MHDMTIEPRLSSALKVQISKYLTDSDHKYADPFAPE
jgi:hypothetical protein